MRNIIDELAVKHDMLSIMQGINYFMLGHILTLDSLNLQKEMTPDNDLLGNYVRLGLCCVVIHDSLQKYKSMMSEENLSSLGQEYDMIMKQAGKLVGYILINRARVREDIKTRLISIILVDSGVSVAIDETLMNGYAQVIIDYIDNALTAYDMHAMMERTDALTKEYDMICELSNQMEKNLKISEA